MKKVSIKENLNAYIILNPIKPKPGILTLLILALVNIINRSHYTWFLTGKMGCVELFGGGLCLCLLGSGLGLLGHLYGRPEGRCCGRRMLGLNRGALMICNLPDFRQGRTYVLPFVCNFNISLNFGIIFLGGGRETYKFL